MKLDILPIDKSKIKYKNERFAIDLAENEYIFEVYWNPVAEIFTFHMYDKTGNPIILGRRIVYGVDMLSNAVDDRLPDLKIIPLDKTGKSEKTGITYENFMESVLPYIIEGETDG